MKDYFTGDDLETQFSGNFHEYRKMCGRLVDNLEQFSQGIQIQAIRFSLEKNYFINIYI